MATLASSRRVREHLATILLGSFALALSAGALGQPADPGSTSPDALWRELSEVEFPPRYEAPTSFTALSLDEAALRALLADAPRETPGVISPRLQIWLPVATEGFAAAHVAGTQLMESGLAEMFPEIGTYVFAGDGIAGNLAIGPAGVFISAQSAAGLWRVVPAQTAEGERVYVSFFERDRSDGLNVEVHDPAMDDRPPPPPVPSIAAAAPASQPVLFANAVESGDQLRIYRLAASTTGEFYQARDTGNGLLDVVFSLVVDIAGANAVFEPEVSVRLVLALTSLLVIYDDPTMDPFDNSDSACTLRNANRDNAKIVLNDADYDIGFLFAARAGGGANGCAWFVVCLTDNDTLHKARGAGLMGNNGANSASGLLAHEVGHQLGARHTFSGQAGSCTLNEFQAGDSESGYEPGSGTTRMSYNGICDSDNVDVDTSTGAVGSGSYFHARSFDEIVDNVFAGDGATCGTLMATSNLPPTVDAGPDYTIPQQTPFTLTGSAVDDEALTYTWEQFDRAVLQRPINTDPGDGPIIRSIPPTSDPSRTVPNLQDLLDGVVRAGEILPQVDRELNFRLSARDNLVGGGGVASDSMVITVDGPAFFITQPNAGALEAACQSPLSWVVGGGSVAAQVEALFSSDGGQNFDVPLTGPVANDGGASFTVPCVLGDEGRIKLQSVGNIFFDVNDNNLSTSNTPPSVQVATAGGAVDDNCEFTVEFTATASDACGLDTGDVQVELMKVQDNYTLGVPTINLNQDNADQVSVAGSVLVSDLLDSPAQLVVKVSATDACGASTSDTAQADVVDDTPPEIDVTLDPDTLWPPNHKMRTIQATVVATDNCPGVGFVLNSVVSDEPENGKGDGNTAPDIAGVDTGTPDLEFDLRSERAGGGDGRTYTATYTAEDGSGNQAVDDASVEVPKSQRKK